MTPPRSLRSPFQVPSSPSDGPTRGTVTRMAWLKGLVDAAAGRVNPGDTVLDAKWPVMSEALPSRKTCTIGENCRRTVTISDLLVGAFERPNFPPGPRLLALSAKSRMYFPALPTKAFPPSDAGPI